MNISQFPHFYFPPFYYCTSQSVYLPCPFKIRLSSLLPLLIWYHLTLPFLIVVSLIPPQLLFSYTLPPSLPLVARWPEAALRPQAYLLSSLDRKIIRQRRPQKPAWVTTLSPYLRLFYYHNVWGYMSTFLFKRDKMLMSKYCRLLLAPHWTTKQVLWVYVVFCGLQWRKL